MTKQELLALIEEYGDNEEININEILRARYEARQAQIEEIEERQHKSGFYAQQDLIDMYRRER